MRRAFVISLLLGAHACIMVIPDSPQEACEPGTLAPCYAGPPETRHVGACQDGIAECLEGGALGVCEREILPALEQCGTDAVADEDCNGHANEHCAHWVAIYGVFGAQGIESMARASGDDLVVAARNSGGRGGARINFGGDNLDTGVWRGGFAVARLGPIGEHRWSDQFLGNNAVLAARVAFDDELGVLVTGSFRTELSYGGVLELSGFTEDETMFVARLDADTGAGLAFAAFPHDAVQFAHAVAGGGDGVIFGGSSEGYVDFGTAGLLRSAGGADAVVAKLDGDLLPSWARLAGDSGDDRILRVVADETGDVYVGGSFAKRIAFDPCPALDAEGESDAFVAKLAGGDGSCLWLRSFGGSGAARAGALTLRGGLYAAVMFSETITDGAWQTESLGDDDMLIAVLDPETGTSRAQRAFGATGDQIVSDLAILPSGSIAVVGTIRGAIDFGGGLMQITLQPMETEPDDAFVLLLDERLEHVFSRQFGAPSDDDAFAVVASESGELVVAGEFANTVDFGTGAKAASSNSVDAYLLRLAP